MRFQQSAAAPYLLVIDAQNYHEKVDGGSAMPSHAWSPWVTAGSLSGTAMRVEPNVRSVHVTATTFDAAPTISFRIRTTLSGAAYVWLRTILPSSPNDDSAHIWLNGVLQGTLNSMNLGTWSTNGRLAVSLPAAGDHVLTIQAREDGFPLDRIILAATSYDAITNGDGESESPQS